MNFEFATAGRILFGSGVANQLGSLAKDLGDRAMIVTGGSERWHGLLHDQLQIAGMAATFFAVEGEPSVTTVQKAVDRARSADCNVIVACGGGSAVDAGKAIAAMLANPGELLDYLEVVGRGRPLTVSPAPCIAIPTTSGTGAEVTRNAVILSPEHQVKVSMRHPLMLPDIALVDPDLTLPLPESVTISTGLDALTQLIEPFISHKANPIVDSLCREAIRRCFLALPLAVADGSNVAARSEMSLASLFSGLALANAGLGAVHGFAGPLGGHIQAPHGKICAALLPVMLDHVLQVLQSDPTPEDTLVRPGNFPDTLSPREHYLQRFRELAWMVRPASGQTMSGRSARDAGTAHSGHSQCQDLDPEYAVQQVRALCQQMKTETLGQLGLGKADVAEMATKSAQSSSMKGSPVIFTHQQLEAMLHQAL